MPLTVQHLRSRFRDQLANGDDCKFLSLLTEADERLLNMGRWHWTREPITLTPDEDRRVILPDDYESIVGARLGSVPRGVRWQEAEFMEDGPSFLQIEGCTGRLIDQGLLLLGSDDTLSRVYRISDVETNEVTALARFASREYTDDAQTVLCPSVAALKQMIMSIIYENANDVKVSMDYQGKAKLTLDEHEAAYRGTAKQVFRPLQAMPLRRRSKNSFP